jgi:DNA-binding NarL/FixJ family response regulator
MQNKEKGSASRPRSVGDNKILTEVESRVCELALLECRTQREIAGWLGVSERAVRKSLNRAMKKWPRLRELNCPMPRVRVIALSQVKSR